MNISYGQVNTILSKTTAVDERLRCPTLRTNYWQSYSWNFSGGGEALMNIKLPFRCYALIIFKILFAYFIFSLIVI